MRGFLAAVVIGCAVLFATPLASADDRLIEDHGGFTPSGEQIALALRLGGAETKVAAVAELDALEPGPRIDVLRAGLRLQDETAARACAARLEYAFIDGWECARCVDLLIDDVLLPDSEASFEEFRSYLGSSELERFFDALPPPPWPIETAYVIGSLHRIARIDHAPAYMRLMEHSDPEVVDAASNGLWLLCKWNDESRVPIHRAFERAAGFPDPGPDQAGGTGLPTPLAAWLARVYGGEPDPDDEHPDAVDEWTRRWLWDCTAGPRDAPLLASLATDGSGSWHEISGAALVLLGQLDDPVTEALLERHADAGDMLAVHALARRGRPEARALLRDFARDGEDFALAALMEVDPPAARALIEELLLGEDEAAAVEMLELLAEFATPGARVEPLGYDWRRTDLNGLAEAAMAAEIPAWRLASIGAVVPGCRTRALAAEAARRLGLADLADPEFEYGGIDATAAFLETAAPGLFARALRDAVGESGLPFASQDMAGGFRLASDEEGLSEEEVRVREAVDRASGWLLQLGHPAAAEAILPASAGLELEDEETPTRLARSGSPVVKRWFERRIRASLEDGALDLGAVAGLAVMWDFPEEALWAFTRWVDEEEGGPDPSAFARLVLAGRPRDALALALEARPDLYPEGLGAVDDPRVWAHLRHLRTRRELGLYWPATAELAVLGDVAARMDWWHAMRKGRYRIMSQGTEFQRTLGWNLTATVPFWIDELRSQCCRIVTNGGGDIIDRLFGIDAYDTSGRIPHERLKELWDSAGGRFVYSRILEHWVPEAR